MIRKAEDNMSPSLIKEARKAISAELQLQESYRKMAGQTQNPKVKAVLHDLLLMEEMNEILLRSLNQHIGFKMYG